MQDFIAFGFLLRYSRLQIHSDLTMIVNYSKCYQSKENDEKEESVSSPNDPLGTYLGLFNTKQLKVYFSYYL